jgi:hypothetical protein
VGKGQLRERCQPERSEVLWPLLTQPCQNPHSPLRLPAHGVRMNSNQLRTLLTSLLGISAIVTWAFVIWAALQVSTVVLNTLEQIVNLAALG